MNEQTNKKQSAMSPATLLVLTLCLHCAICSGYVTTVAIVLATAPIKKNSDAVSFCKKNNS